MELKECPFCGSKPTEYFAQDITYGYDEAYWIACARCKIGQDPHECLTRSESTDRWNLRVKAEDVNARD